MWDLSSLRKGNSESFREYAQRWRSLAAKVATPIPEKDLTSTFINTLEKPYFSHLIGHTATNFSEIIAAGCRIESTITSGKLLAQEILDKKPISVRPPNKPKEATVSVINSSNYVKPTQQVTFQPNSNPDTPPTQQPTQQSNRFVRRQFTRIPIRLSQVLARLRANKLINFEVPKEGYKPRNYDPDLKCDYHLG